MVVLLRLKLGSPADKARIGSVRYITTQMQNSPKRVGVISYDRIVHGILPRELHLDTTQLSAFLSRTQCQRSN